MALVWPPGDLCADLLLHRALRLRLPPGGLVTSPTASTSSRGSRTLGIATAVGLAVFLLFALVLSPPDTGSENDMGQLVRIMYVHVPVAITCFLAFAVTAFGGVMWLWKKSEAWDLLAAASAQ